MVYMTQQSLFGQLCLEPVGEVAHVPFVIDVGRRIHQMLHEYIGDRQYLVIGFLCKVHVSMLPVAAFSSLTRSVNASRPALPPQPQLPASKLPAR